MLSNQLAKMLMMLYSRCNYWVTHVKQPQLIQLLEFYLIYPIRDRYVFMVHVRVCIHLGIDILEHFLV